MISMILTNHRFQALQGTQSLQEPVYQPQVPHPQVQQEPFCFPPQRLQEVQDPQGRQALEQGMQVPLRNMLMWSGISI